MSFWRKRPRWPPSPCVEDELDSLSRELHGLSKLGDKPGVEGVCSRGTIDQHPLILDVTCVFPVSRSTRWEDPGREGSSDDSTGPPTPPPHAKQDPALNLAKDSNHKAHSSKAVPAKVSERSKTAPPAQISRTSKSSSSRQSSSSRKPDITIHIHTETKPKPTGSTTSRNSSNMSTRKPQTLSISTNTPGDPPSKPASSATRKRSQSVKQERPSSKSTELKPPMMASGYTSDSVTLESKKSVRSEQGPGVSERNGSAAVTQSLKVTSQKPHESSTVKRTSETLAPKPTSSATPKPSQPIKHEVTSQPQASSVVKSTSGSIPPKTAPSAIPKESQSIKHEVTSQKPQESSTVKRTSEILPPKTAPSATLKPSQPTKHGPPSNPPTEPVTQGSVSDSVTMDPKVKDQTKQVLKTSERSHGDSSTTPSLAQRIEEKLRLRQERQEQQQPNAPPEEVVPQDTSAGSNPAPSNPAPLSNALERKADPEGYSSDSAIRQAPPQRPPLKSVLKSSKLATGTSSDKEDAAPNTVRFADLPPVVKNLPERSVSTDEARPTQLATRRAVSFVDEAPQPPPLQIVVKDEKQAKISRQESPVRELVRSASAINVGLLPCPRSVPMAGHQDWYTIKGLNHLNICPGCTSQMRKTRFRDSFIVGNPRPPSDKVRCSMSFPWTRLAWTQTLKKQLDHLNLLHEVTHPMAGSKPCTGRVITDQLWYRIVDPDTGVSLPKFNVCSACVRNVRVLMPVHRDTFTRSTVMQKRICDFVSDSPRFIRYIDTLDIAASRAETTGSSQPDLDEFMAYARRKVVLRDCRRDRPILSTWHYMPQLPEFTVCEDCYDDVVWPLVRANQPLARKFSSQMRLLPGDGPSRCREASCQLYSPRIRAKFQDAVQMNDLNYLRLIALKRYDVERQVRERKKDLLDDESRGYDCDSELRETLLEWKRWE